MTVQYVRNSAFSISENTSANHLINEVLFAKVKEISSFFISSYHANCEKTSKKILVVLRVLISFEFCFIN